jgi:hypothetical protein
VQGGARCGRKDTPLILSGAEEAMEVAREELALRRIPSLMTRRVNLRSRATEQPSALQRKFFEAARGTGPEHCKLRVVSVSEG